MPRRALLLLLLALVVAGCGPADEADQPATTAATAPTTSAASTAADTAPTPVAVAKPADDVEHPGSRTEWWYAHAMDPVSGRTIIVTMFRSPLPAIGGFWYSKGDMKRWTELSLPVDHTGPGTSLQAGSITYDEARNIWRIRARTGGYTINFDLTNPRPGITAGPLKFGADAMYWTVPVATSNANGFLKTPDGTRVAIRNWRGYHDHNWGPFSLESDQYRGWEWAVAHEPDGHAVLLGGVTPNDGPFKGVLARISPERTRFCRTGADLSDWTTVDGFRFPQTVSASCDKLSATFTVTRPLVVGLSTHALTESVAVTEAPGSIGLVEHLARKEP